MAKSLETTKETIRDGRRVNRASTTVEVPNLDRKSKLIARAQERRTFGVNEVTETLGEFRDREDPAFDIASPTGHLSDLLPKMRPEMDVPIPKEKWKLADATTDITPPEGSKEIGDWRVEERSLGVVGDAKDVHAPAEGWAKRAERNKSLRQRLAEQDEVFEHLDRLNEGAGEATGVIVLSRSGAAKAVRERLREGVKSGVGQGGEGRT